MAELAGQRRNRERDEPRAGRGSRTRHRELLVPTPLNPSVLASLGGYRRAVTLLSPRETAVQRNIRRIGIRGIEVTTQPVLLTLMQYAPPGAVFWDVGSHLAWYSTLLTTVYARRGVSALAFEPTPRTALLARRVARANHARVKVRRVAVADTPGTATLYVSDRAESSNSLDPTFREHVGKVTVPVTSLDATAGRRRGPAVVKIDVENREAPVLAGAREMVERYRPWIVCEILPQRSDDALAPEIGHLARLGYRFLALHGNPPFPTWDGGGPVPDIEGCRDWLFAPGPLPATFRRDVRRWQRALSRCGPDANQLLPVGTPLPPRWNRHYTGEDVTGVADRLVWRRAMRAQRRP